MMTLAPSVSEVLSLLMTIELSFTIVIGLHYRPKVNLTQLNFSQFDLKQLVWTCLNLTQHDLNWLNSNQLVLTQSLTWLSFSCFYLAWLDLTWLDLTWLGLTWLDLTWLDLTWLDLTWLDLTWLDLTWLDLTWLDLTWLDLTWLDLTWLDLTWLDLTSVPSLYKIVPNLTYIHNVPTFRYFPPSIYN
jgi:uncharacterized protein YjbI with pentapeptide repeats